MNPQTIRDAVRSSPFNAFTLRMNDGREFYVPHPELIAIGSTHVYLIDEKTDRGIFLEPRLIASMEMEPGRSKSSQ